MHVFSYSRKFVGISFNKIRAFSKAEQLAFPSKYSDVHLQYSPS